MDDMRRTPMFAVVMAAATAITSVSSSVIVHGSPYETVTTRELMSLGAVDGKALTEGAWWRLLSCQLLHVRPAHMAFNVLMLLAVGSGVEASIGWGRALALYFVSGTAGVASALISSPTLVGSGASQGLMGLAAAGVVLCLHGHRVTRWLVAAVSTLLLTQAALDVAFAQHLKRGHVVAFLVGLGLSALLVPRRASRPTDALPRDRREGR